MDFEPEQKEVYNMFEALVDVVHGEKTEKLKLAKCTQCERFNTFRPKSKGMKSTAFYCNHCGSIICFGTNGKTAEIHESAEIFCENCEDDCRKCQINKLADETVFRKRR
ncbi:MAG: hypothetical protein WC325_01595 [Candidatus Bathyarchaeia archaeon]